MISAAERHVMDVLWDKSPATAEQIADVLCPVHDWAPATIKTLLNRLLNKGAIEANRIGRKFHYRPIKTRDAYVEEESQGFLDRVFNGDVSAMVSHFSTSKRLNPDDLAALKAMIARLEKDG